MAMAQYKNLLPGDPAPWFRQRTMHHSDFGFDSVGGRYAVLGLYISAGDPVGRRAVDTIAQLTDVFDGKKAFFFGVSCDVADVDQGRISEQLPGIRHFLDHDAKAAKLYGGAPIDAGNQIQARRLWIVIDPMLRVMKVFPFADDGSDIQALASYMRALPPPDRYAGIELQAPILLLPNVFEPEFCSQLIGLYETNGGTESGVSRDIDGKTQVVIDHTFKRRRDFNIDDNTLIQTLQGKFLRRVVPEIQKAHQFKVTRMERYLVACYAAEDEAHFHAHRDNTTAGTAHRRFAVSINLNSDFDGGEVSFPEYGPRSFKPPPGGAVVFSCSLLHAVSKVTRGKRYAFLPFLYDDEAAKIRIANNEKLGEGIGAYSGN